MQADMPPPDRGESIALMEPMLVPSGAARRGELLDKILVLAQQSAGLRRSLPGHLATSLAGLVRSMNCYYSNLIEGHDTHPVDIERALRQDFSADARQRNLQLEARAQAGGGGPAGSGRGHVRKLPGPPPTCLPRPPGPALDARPVPRVPGRARWAGIEPILQRCNTIIINVCSQMQHIGSNAEPLDSVLLTGQHVA
ncbi:hypothetical protein DGI_2451 [Megalodesulfovibrio gigas DSM 1382 = ATCC 19364]|uniref:Uncharacterized protein n=1 Tax=Megalodesulfovibrio gigas (strain ATCC 19364 / DSM 1382 / NCIMB 9332 / VKM B-1759) TaxID=1121448 RepID=T2GDE4_MEGG1|nr:hypothetical protein DGI_2451 [Megalodesulfovibrio gigas DSM 1382 = ATCC 19364]